MNRVFLGGTCNESTWREQLISLLKIDYFNPVVDDWNEKTQKNEFYERKNCDFCLYVVTPKMIGSYAIAEVIDDSNKRPEKTIFAFLTKDDEKIFDKGQIRSLNNVAKMVKNNGGKIFYSLIEIANYLNKA